MNYKIFRRSSLYLAIIILIGLISFLHNAARDNYVVKDTRFMMGTIVEIKVSYPRGSIYGTPYRKAMDKAFDEISRLERIFSVYRDDSELSRVNKMAAKGPVVVSDELFFVIEKSVEYNSKTNGAFDVTIKPMKDLWQDARLKGTLPDAAMINERRSMTGAGSILLDKKSRAISFAREGVSIDLGGIAKGYAVDCAARVLKENGINNAIVNAGGDTYCMGSKNRDDGWKVGIQDPRDKKAIVRDLYIKDKGVDTSGDYERYFIIGSKRYSHIIDPRSGIPIGDDIVSATVIANDSMTADVFATALCVLGEEGLRLAESNGVDALIMKKTDGALKTYMTKDFDDKYAVKK